jgi:hypothetical protein
MDPRHGVYRYTTLFVEDREGGSAGLELFRDAGAEKELAASLIFWDASGQFFLQTFCELPLDIVEVLITEVRQAVKTS